MEKVARRVRVVTVKHLAAKLSGCDKQLLNDEKRLKEMLDEVSSSVKMTVLRRATHRFEPQGVSLVYLLAESHISLHTWPECGLADIEIVSCNKESDLMEGLRFCIERLGATEHDYRIWTFTHHY